MTDNAQHRRNFLAGAGFAASTALLVSAAGCAGTGQAPVGAVEDLMREHGVIRRAILGYRAAAAKLRMGAAVDPVALRQATVLLRSFGEDYHEKQLEEAHIFPAVTKAGGPAAALVGVLQAQHQRGREITAYVLGVVSGGAIGTGLAEPLANALDNFELMYAHHAAREDTILFPAWRATMSAREYDEIGETFEDLEKQQFGEDGYEAAVTQIAQVEQALGIDDLAQFTPRPPQG
jgi:hemerythrin-like domain-containing protein